MPYRKIPPKRKWKAIYEVRALARQYSAKAMDRLVELIDAESEFVAVNAARTVLLRSEMDVPRRNPRLSRKQEKLTTPGVKVTIAQFKEEKKSGTARRDRKLPVVQRGREGSRDAGDGDGAGVPALPRQRTGVRDEP